METKDLWRDPIVEEVRQARRAHAKKFGNDLAAIAEDLKRHEQGRDRKVVSLPRRRLRSEKGAA